MGPEALAQVLRPLAEMFAPEDHPEVLRGLHAPDDAAVYRLDDRRAVVLTADFFPPVVDDPYHFGAVAAANALSDLYAMGADPLFGINLVGFPEALDPSILSEILRGGAEKMREAGAVVAGGHTTTDREPKYGLAVAGVVDPANLFSKGGARPGDVLLLTKALGTGVITTAHKSGKVEEGHLQAAITEMERLNGVASGLLREAGSAVHALTDVTGFGLAGHAHEMAHQSGVALRLRFEAIPLLPGARDYARRGLVTGGARRNAQYYGRWITHERRLDDWERELLFDPQTSGGLLAAVAPERADAVVESFRKAGEGVSRIGEAVESPAGGLVFC